MKSHYYLLLTPLFIICFLFSGCKKSEAGTETVSVISIDPSFLNITKDPAYSYGLKVTADQVILDSTQVKWSSGNPRIAAVNAAGYVTGTGAGETDITVTLNNGKGTAKCKVTVSDGNDYKYRLVLKDKGTSAFSITKPEEFLSAKAIEKRRKRNIPIDVTDLPISPDYIKQIQKTGGVIIAQSKWLNTVSVHVNDEFLIDKYRQLPFVKDVILVWEGKRSVKKAMQNNSEKGADTKAVSSAKANSESVYGAAFNNININNGQVLHEKGFKGAGIDIAIIDAGFINLNTNPLFTNMKIKGAKSFVYENSDPYSIDSHGVWVTSCMAVNKPGYYVGTAPEANYWLLRTEDQASEYPIEEDYWVNAIEYADSVGVDIVNSSLSYTNTYSIISARYKFEDMDGKTALATRAVNLAAKKGIFIVNCAGNEQSWVGTPADSPNVLTLGSINITGNIDTFSSWGITVDGRIKPDVVALGGGAAVINVDGIAENRSGTSYASPIMCGLAACLWQAYPQLTNKELLEVIRKSADRYGKPEIPYGYGIPDMQKAMQLAGSK